MKIVFINTHLSNCFFCIFLLLVSVAIRSIQISPTNEIHLKSPHQKNSEAVAAFLQKETITDSSQNSLPTHAVNTNKEVKPAALMFPKPETLTKTKHGVTDKMFSEVVSISSARKNDISHTGRDVCESQSQLSNVPSRLNIRDDHRGILVSKRPREKDLDPLSTFMMLRSQQRSPQSCVNTAGTLCCCCEPHLGQMKADLCLIFILFKNIYTFSVFMLQKINYSFVV